MKITLKNIGVFKQAEYELGQLTIICGENNTGKTYATYALYGFFDFWSYGYFVKVEDSLITELMNKGSISIPIKSNIKQINQELVRACNQYTKYLPQILATQEKYFEHSTFLIELNEDEVLIRDSYERSWRTGKSEMIQISKESGKNEVSISLLVDPKDIDTISTRINLANAIGQALKEIMFGSTFSDIFIASAERTGAAIFKKDLNFEQNRLIKEIAGSTSTDVDISEIIGKVYDSGYALPVKRNIDFIRKLEDITKQDSFIFKEHFDILVDFSDIIGGDYKIGKEGLFFLPKTNKTVKLSMGESSSSVRSLLDVGFYLRYVAEKGDLLMIDEPELNLHPSNQRKLAKLFARLVNIGIKVFITTHSDYIIKELNTLIMLNCRKESEITKKLMHKYKYNESELINYQQIKVFISDKVKVQLDGNPRKSSIQTLEEAKIDEFYGIEAKSFDKTIDEMNFIQESILFGEED